MMHIENQKVKWQKSKSISKIIKCEWINQSNQNSEISRMDEKQDVTLCCI